MNDYYPICEHVNCVQSAEQYLHPSSDMVDGDVYEWLCDKHAAEFGYCLGCHEFWGGFESYEFSPVPGFCPECVEAFRIETGEYDDFDEDDFFDDMEV